LIRKNNCTSAPVHLNSKEYSAAKSKLQKDGNTNILSHRGTCIVCNNKNAAYWCLGCHHFFCFGNQCPITSTTLTLKVPGQKKQKNRKKGG